MKLFGSESGDVNLVKRGARIELRTKAAMLTKRKKTKKATEGKQENKQNACGNCGLIHIKGQCLAYGKQCNTCKNINALCKNVSFEQRCKLVSTTTG